MIHIRALVNIWCDAIGFQPHKQGKFYSESGITFLIWFGSTKDSEKNTLHENIKIKVP